mmetsp:Transcript_7268/g.22373  ORF Transcript_7268/g.22373 Transcript_7268/m.22373 type:complete len:427 (-) Transcript_7268:11-1291(-)
MVVLSASVVTKSGRVVVARQFVEMNRLRVEGLLAAFPKLMGSGNKQHTFIETDTVRYVWQPVEQFFLVLITNKASNIVEDLDTLRLLSKLVPEIVGGHTEEKLADKCFELVFAFDEVITPGGYREYIDLRQIRQNLEMDSHEEKLHNMVRKTKMDSAKDQANHMSRVIRSRQKEAAKSGGVSTPGTMTGISGGSDGSPVEGFERLESSNSAMRLEQDTAGYEPTLPTVREPGEPLTARAPTNVQSIKLGKSSLKGSTLLDKVAKEDNLNLSASLATLSKKSAQNSATTEIADVLVPKLPITIVVDERLSCQLSQEGALENFDMKGTLSVTANEDSASKTLVFITEHPNGSSLPTSTTFQVHPKVNKSEWESRKVLTLKDKDKGFPVGRPVGVLRWSLQSNAEDSLVPFLVNCWPEDEGDGTLNVSI